MSEGVSVYLIGAASPRCSLTFCSMYCGAALLTPVTSFANQDNPRVAPINPVTGLTTRDLIAPVTAAPTPISPARCSRAPVRVFSSLPPRFPPPPPPTAFGALPTPPPGLNDLTPETIED